MLDFLIFPVPTLHIDDSNRLTSITLSYQLTDGSDINPRHLMSSGIDLRIADMEFFTSPTPNTTMITIIIPLLLRTP
jgi:hypothetical protein